MEQDVSLIDQIACVQREVKMREHVYPRFVAAHRMTAVKAGTELEAMRAVLRTLQALPGAEPAQRNLV